MRGHGCELWAPELIDEVDDSESKDNARTKNHENFCGQDALPVLWAHCRSLSALQRSLHLLVTSTFQILCRSILLRGSARTWRDVYEYTSRLLRAIGYPPLVLPTHWDRFNLPYSASQRPAMERLQSFTQEVKAASPNTQVIVPTYFQPISVKPGSNGAKPQEP